MARKKKRIVVPPEPGDLATFTDWLGSEWITIKVTKLFESKAYGAGVEGVEVDGGKFRAFPLSNMIEEGRATNISHGKWDVELPDGKVTRLKSRKAAVQFCQDYGVVFTEVSL